MCFLGRHILFIFAIRRKSLAKLESAFQKQLIDELRYRFQGCVVLKNDSAYLQGVPDLIVLFQNKWAMLECKRSANSPQRPNQEYYVDMMNEMSYATFVHPENVEEVLLELQQVFSS